MTLEDCPLCDGEGASRTHPDEPCCGCNGTGKVDDVRDYLENGDELDKRNNNLVRRP